MNPLAHGKVTQYTLRARESGNILLDETQNISAGEHSNISPEKSFTAIGTVFLYKVHFVKLNKLLTVNPSYTDGTDCVNVPQLARCLRPVLLEPPACFVSSLPVFSVPFVTSLKTKDRALNVSVLVCSLTCETSRGRTF